MNNVATPTSTVKDMIAEAEPVRTLVAGTAAMRKAGEKYLPKSPAESVPGYQANLKRSVLFNATGKTVKDMTGKVFAKPVTFEKDVDPELVAYAENIDMAGRHINVFARDVFEDCMQPGIGFIVADMPPAVQRVDGQAPTLADEQRAGQRPYLVFIPLERVGGWKSENIGGVETLTQFRFMESATEDDGEFHEKEVPQVRVLERGTWRVFRQDSKSNWTLHEEGTTSLADVVPVAPVYINRTAFMCGEPPLSDIADLNIAHWQQTADCTKSLHYASTPILFAKGVETEGELEVGAGTIIRASSPEADLKYVEHTGAAIAAAQKQLDRLEFEMQTMGLQLLVPKPGGQTATGAVLDNAKENSPLAMMATALQDALEQAFGFMARFAGKTFNAGGSIVVNKEFAQAGTGDLQMLLDAVNSGQLSRETFLSEWQRRGALSDSVNLTLEMDRISTEAPELNGRGSMNLDT